MTATKRAFRAESLLQKAQVAGAPEGAASRAQHQELMAEIEAMYCESCAVDSAAGGHNASLASDEKP